MAEISSNIGMHKQGTSLGERTQLSAIVIVYMITVVMPVLVFVGPLLMSSLRLLLLIMLIPLVSQLLSGRYGRILPIDILFFLHIGWMTLSLAANSPDKVVENTGSAVVEFLGGYMIGRAYIRDRTSFVTMAKFLALLIVITFPLALLESQTGQPTIINFIKKIPGLWSYGNVNNEPRMGLERTQTLFAHPIHYGLFASLGFSLVFVGLANVIDGMTRLALSLIIGICVFLSLSSGALLAMVMHIGLILWAFFFRNTEARWKILLVVFIICYIVVDVLSNRTPLQVFMSYATFNAHNAYWRSIIFEWGFQNVIGNAERGIPPAPFFGIGLNDWIRPHFMRSGTMDNFWLVLAVRNGFPGFLTLAGGYFWLLWRVGRTDLGKTDQVLLDLRRAWVFTLAGLSFTLATVHIWGTLYSFAFFFVGAGVWFLTAEPEGAEGPDGAPAPADPQPSRGTSYTRFPGGAVAAPDAGAERRAILSDEQKQAWDRAQARGKQQRRAPGPRTSRLLQTHERRPR